jgi:hypothetical protein
VSAVLITVEMPDKNWQTVIAALRHEARISDYEATAKPDMARAMRRRANDARRIADEIEQKVTQ